MEAKKSLSRQGAAVFAEKYSKAKSERQLAQSFWRDFFTDVCEVPDLLAAGYEFEYPVRQSSAGTVGFVDVFLPHVVLIEHKSAGMSLDSGEKQAREYLKSLPSDLRPTALIICDFKRWRIIELLEGTSVDFLLSELPDNLFRIESIFEGNARGATSKQLEADIKASKLMSNLFVAFEQAGYGGHEVSVFLIRVLFLMFGDDTKLWPRVGREGLFQKVVSTSSPDGNGLGGAIQEVFQVMNQIRDERPRTLSDTVNKFPYTNGGIFAETLPVFSFTKEMRQALLDACQYDWFRINPSIFGAMFQNIKSQEARRELGEHYTSEENILKVISPMFLNDFYVRLKKEWDSPRGLRKFRMELGTYTFADPACGCGNFLLVIYKRLRELELRIAARLKELKGGEKGEQDESLLGYLELSIKLSQFHGIEIEEWSSQIASVALFLAEHQSNVAMEEVLGSAPDLLPLSDAPIITHGNALRLDWSTLFPMNDRTFIIGNPPFNGARLQPIEQKDDTNFVWGKIKGVGNLDYVSNWFRIAAKHCVESRVRAAFVATNSIAQGEQPPIIWGQLLPMGIGIDFAHQAFEWQNEASGQAAVHTVIIGFSTYLKPVHRSLWQYATVRGFPEHSMVKNINPYLLDAPNVLISSRKYPLNQKVQPLLYGSQPNDGGFLSDISDEEAVHIRNSDPIAANYLRRLIGARELLHNELRWCLWLVDVTPEQLNRSTILSQRISEVRSIRQKSSREATRELANTPWLFGFISQPTSKYLAVPLHSSEDRDYLPTAFYEPEVIANNSISVVPSASLETFGVLSSRAFRIWAEAISGRLESRTRISGTITYNNFPFPYVPESGRLVLDNVSQKVLDVRAEFPSSSLADLYNPSTMPQMLRAAHNDLDRVIGDLLQIGSKATESQVLSRIFKLYEAQSGGLLNMDE